jgi:hypothetical protein
MMFTLNDLPSGFTVYRSETLFSHDFEGEMGIYGGPESVQWEGAYEDGYTTEFDYENGGGIRSSAYILANADWAQRALIRIENHYENFHGFTSISVPKIGDQSIGLQLLGNGDKHIIIFFRKANVIAQVVCYVGEYGEFRFSVDDVCDLANSLLAKIG